MGRYGGIARGKVIFMNQETASIMFTLVAIIPVVGFLVAATPFLMRRGEVFAVTVPTAAAKDPYLQRLKHRFAAIVAIATILFTAAGAASAVAVNEQSLLIVLVVSTLVLCVGSYALMLRYRAKTRAYKKQQGWKAEAQESVASIGAGLAPKAISLKWNLIYIPVIALTLAVGVAGYPYLPDMVPMHTDLAGNVNSWTPKGPGVVLFPVAVQMFMGACFVFSHWSITRSKKALSPEAPAASAWAYGMFARAQSVFLMLVGLLLTLAIGVTFELSALSVISLQQAAVIMVGACVPILIGSVVLSVVYGQSGSRVFKGLAASATMAADDDEHWKLGVFYWNPQDASLFLPERFGIGWTMNWARPAAWAIVVGGIVFTAVFMAVAFAAL